MPSHRLHPSFSRLANTSGFTQTGYHGYLKTLYAEAAASHNEDTNSSKGISHPFLSIVGLGEESKHNPCPPSLIQRATLTNRRLTRESQKHQGQRRWAKTSGPETKQAQHSSTAKDPKNLQTILSNTYVTNRGNYVSLHQALYALELCAQGLEYGFAVLAPSVEDLIIKRAILKGLRISS